MLSIDYPNDCASETIYILSVIFDQFLGLPYRTTPTDGDIFRLSAEGREISLPSVFFPALDRGEAAALAAGTPRSWDSGETGWDIPLIDPILPVLFGTPAHQENDRHIHLGLDIFGAAFFMLSRFEETLGARHDVHGRFPAKESMAYRHGFLLRPIIDEYVEVLFAAMQRLWPGMKRKERHFRITPSHDVDIPYLGLSLNSPKLLLQRCAGDLLKRRSPALAARTIRSYGQARSVGGRHDADDPCADDPCADDPCADDPFAGDPYNVFDWIMTLGEKAGVPSRFYFMTDHEPHHRYGGGYDINTPHIERLIKDIAARGHEIGIHPTGESFRDRTTMLGQSARFFKALTTLGVQQEVRGGRHHYLLWQTDRTPRFWHDAGLSYDSTLGFAEHVGFRCGTCHPFPLWDHASRERLDVEEWPLIVMECSLLDEHYMGYAPSRAAKVIKELRDAVRTVKGNFVFLWHNSALIAPSDRDLYRACLDL